MIKIKPLNRYPLILILFLTSGYANNTATDTQAPEQKLENIRTEIEKITAVLEKDLGSRDQLQTKLKQIEKQLNSLNQERLTLNSTITLKRGELANLNGKKLKLDQQLQRQHQQLSEQIVSAYKIGRQEQIKLILNQTEPDALNRVLSYYRYFNHARLTFMQAISQQVDQINQLKSSISTEMSALEKLNEKKQRSAEKLTDHRHKREAVLSEINQNITQYGVQINQLKADERRVHALIQSLSGLLSDIPETITNRPFASLKGQLNWPTKGNIEHKFGEKRGNSDLVWQGVSIHAPAGQAIQAISHGRIAFSDWLQGFGLLLIVDHQDGFMSLYAHNDTLYKETGDWVNHGETIASVGSTGGLTDPRLYLEIRHQGIPVNPEQWFKNKI